MNIWQRGFSMVTALIGLAVVGGFGLVIMQQQESAAKLQSKDNADQVVNSATNVVQVALASRAVCSASLRGKLVGDEVSHLYDAQVKATDINDEDLATTNILDQGQMLPGDIQVQNMKVASMKDKITNTFKDYFIVTFNRNPTGRKKLVGPNVVPRFVELQLIKDPITKKITSCYAEMNGAIDLAHQQSCLELGGAWNGTTCVHQAAPIYYNSSKGALVATPGTLYGEVLINIP